MVAERRPVGPAADRTHRSTLFIVETPMFKNGIVKALAVVAILGAAACGRNEDAPAVEQTPATETVAPAPETAPLTDPALTDTVVAPAGETQLEQGAVEAPATQPGY
jgi:hypothetical protein